LDPPSPLEGRTLGKIDRAAERKNRMEAVAEGLLQAPAGGFPMKRGQGQAHDSDAVGSAGNGCVLKWTMRLSRARTRAKADEN
jgi:hypothetical protein